MPAQLWARIEMEIGAATPGLATPPSDLITTPRATDR